MPINLTDEDRAAITMAIRTSWDADDDGYDEDNPDHRERRLAAIDAAIYRAGLAAGRERAIEECAKVCDRYEQHKWHIYKEDDGDLRADPHIQGRSDGAADCAAAIRALNAS